MRALHESVSKSLKRRCCLRDGGTRVAHPTRVHDKASPWARARPSHLRPTRRLDACPGRGRSEIVRVWSRVTQKTYLPGLSIETYLVEGALRARHFLRLAATTGETATVSLAPRTSFPWFDRSTTLAATKSFWVDVRVFSNRLTHRWDRMYLQ